MRMLTLVMTPALARMASWLLPVICSAFSLRLASSLSSTHWSLQASLSTLQESAALQEGPHSGERLQFTHIPSLKKSIHSQVVLNFSKNCKSNKFVKLLRTSTWQYHSCEGRVLCVSILIIMTKLRTSLTPGPPLEAGARGRSGHSRGSRRISRPCSAWRWCPPRGGSPGPVWSSRPRRLHTPACKRGYSNAFTLNIGAEFPTPRNSKLFALCNLNFSKLLEQHFRVLKGMRSVHLCSRPCCWPLSDVSWQSEASALAQASQSRGDTRVVTWEEHPEKQSNCN